MKNTMTNISILEKSLNISQKLSFYIEQGQVEDALRLVYNLADILRCLKDIDKQIKNFNINYGVNNEH